MIKTLVLGLVQGFTEFLPVSSSGHLVLLQRAMDMPDTGLLLEILLHVGSLSAVLAVFLKDWLHMLRHLFTSKPLRLLLVATIPGMVIALLLKSVLNAQANGLYLAFSFLATSALLLLSEAFAKRGGKHRRMEVEDIRYSQALAMGAMQGVSALAPGLSRSGSTLVIGLATGITREAAAKFAFMMSVPAILGSLALKLKDLLSTGGEAFQGGMAAAALGMVAAALSAYVAIRFMLRIITRVSLKWFSLYTAALSFCIFIDLLFFGFLFQRIL